MRTLAWAPIGPIGGVANVRHDAAVDLGHRGLLRRHGLGLLLRGARTVTVDRLRVLQRDLPDAALAHDAARNPSGNSVAAANILLSSCASRMGISE